MGLIFGQFHFLFVSLQQKLNYGKEENIKRIDKRCPYAEFL